jgi:hypothetical protein
MRLQATAEAVAEAAGHQRDQEQHERNDDTDRSPPKPSMPAIKAMITSVTTRFSISALRCSCGAINSATAAEVPGATASLKSGQGGP